MNQAELRSLSEERLQDARALIDGGRYNLAYYIAGYALECGLKSCVLARMIHTGWIFKDDARKVDPRTHDFLALINIADLKTALDDHLASTTRAGGEFARNWKFAMNWKVDSRYKSWTEVQARELYAAIADEPHGVLTWIRNYW